MGAPTWPDGSLGAAHLRSELNVPSYGDFPIVREAVYAAMLATLSGVDHALAWTVLVEEGSTSVALATVARGALEGLAKSYYLLSAPDTREFVARHISVSLADLKYPLQYSRFQDFTGTILDNHALPELHRELVARLDLTLVTPTAQEYVRSLLTAGMRPGEVADFNIYSQLSGAAHAATSALGMYRDETGATFYLPTEIATEEAGYLFAGVCVVAEEWLSVFGADETEISGWRSTRRSAETNVARMI